MATPKSLDVVPGKLDYDDFWSLPLEGLFDWSDFEGLERA